MELTQEQKERIKQNRDRALEIQRQRKILQLSSAVDEDSSSNATIASATKRGLGTNLDNNGSNRKRMKDEKLAASSLKGVERVDTFGGNVNVGSTNGAENDNDEMYHTVEIEAFEENASEYVTKQEAMKVYCLPLGTLDVCRNCISKPNPKHATWSNMKLYLRKEIRYRAHQRYGGMVGLIEERNRRNQVRLQKDMEQSKDIFK
jgi:XPA protein C-terminus